MGFELGHPVAKQIEHVALGFVNGVEHVTVDLFVQIDMGTAMVFITHLVTEVGHLVVIVVGDW